MLMVLFTKSAICYFITLFQQTGQCAFQEMLLFPNQWFITFPKGVGVGGCVEMVDFVPFPHL